MASRVLVPLVLLFAASCTRDADGDGFPEGEDCDDAASSVFPGAPEVCNGADDDCDEVIEGDEPVSTFFADADGDGTGDAAVTAEGCAAPDGFVSTSGDCDDQNPHPMEGCWGVFDGTTGAAWEPLAEGIEPLYSLQSYLPADQSIVYNFFPSVGQAYDVETNTWSPLSSVSPVVTLDWLQLAPVGADYYGIRNGFGYRYRPADDSWATLAKGLDSEEFSMNVSDEDGLVYSMAGSVVLVWDTTLGTVRTFATNLTPSWEPRLAYDRPTRTLLFGWYDLPNLWVADPVTYEVTELAPIPESQLNDIFCGDGTGHLYAAGGENGQTMWRYDLATNEWSRIPDLPVDHDNNGTCFVAADGWLYVGVGGSRGFYRLELH